MSSDRSIASTLAGFRSSLGAEPVKQPSSMVEAKQRELMAEGYICDLILYAELLEIVAERLDIFGASVLAERWRARAATLRVVDGDSGGFRVGQHLSERRAGRLLDWLLMGWPTAQAIQDREQIGKDNADQAGQAPSLPGQLGADLETDSGGEGEGSL